MRFGAAGKGGAVTNRAYRGAGRRRVFQTRISRTPRTPLRLRKDMDMGDIPPFNQNSRAITVPALPLRYPQTGCRRCSQGSALAKRAYRGEEYIARTKHAYREEEGSARTKRAHRGEEENTRTKRAYRRDRRVALSKMRRSREAYNGVSPLHRVRLQTPLARLP